jgi:cytochrome P450
LQNFPHKIDKNSSDNAVFFPGFKDSLLVMPTSDVWSRKRHLANPTLNLSRGDFFINILLEHCTDLCDDIKDGDEVNLQKLAKRMAMRAIASILIGGSFREKSIDYEEEGGVIKKLPID